MSSSVALLINVVVPVLYADHRPSSDWYMVMPCLASQRSLGERSSGRSANKKSILEFDFVFVLLGNVLGNWCVFLRVSLEG